MALYIGSFVGSLETIRKEGKMGKRLKVGVERGGGPAPGYRWSVSVLDEAIQEVMTFLTVEQYQHLSFQFKELAMEDDPTHSMAASVDAVEDFFELREKGGILGKINVRIFFCIDKPRSSIIVLGGIKKENEGSTKTSVKIRISRRKRRYFDGKYFSSGG